MFTYKENTKVLMGSSSLLHHLIILFLSVSQVVGADERLMEQQCHYANDPTICMQCLKSDPTSPQSDPVGLARIILKCITSHVNTLSRSVSTLASIHHEMPVRTALTRCHWAYRTTKSLVDRADDCLSRRVYNEAKFFVSRTFSLPMDCEKNLEALKLALPPTFPNHTLLLTAMTDAELNMIDHI